MREFDVKGANYWYQCYEPILLGKQTRERMKRNASFRKSN